MGRWQGRIADPESNQPAPKLVCLECLHYPPLAARAKKIANTIPGLVWAGDRTRLQITSTSSRFQHRAERRGTRLVPHLAVPKLLALGRLQRRLRNLADRYVLRIPARADNPYTTHLPVLLAAARQRRVRRILELGSGTYSTPTFLDRNYFPDVEKVDAIENDASWSEKAQAAAGNDPRLAIRTISGAVAAVVDTLDVGTYDLALVDDSATALERTATLSRVAAQRPKATLVVVHDFETEEYREAAQAFLHRVRITSLNPNVGLLWNDAMPEFGWRQFNAWLARHRDQVPLDDRTRWRRLIEQEAMGFLAPVSNE